MFLTSLYVGNLVCLFISEDTPFVKGISVQVLLAVVDTQCDYHCAVLLVTVHRQQQPAVSCPRPPWIYRSTWSHYHRNQDETRLQQVSTTHWPATSGC